MFNFTENTFFKSYDGHSGPKNRPFFSKSNVSRITTPTQKIPNDDIVANNMKNAIMMQKNTKNGFKGVTNEGSEVVFSKKKHVCPKLPFWAIFGVRAIGGNTTNDFEHFQLLTLFLDRGSSPRIIR